MTLTLYTKPRCVQCDATKRALDRSGIAYEIVDVTQDAAAYAYVTETLGYRQVPVVVTSDTHWSGFRPDLIKAVSSSHVPIVQ